MTGLIQSHLKSMECLFLTSGSFASSPYKLQEQYNSWKSCFKRTIANYCLSRKECQLQMKFTCNGRFVLGFFCYCFFTHLTQLKLSKVRTCHFFNRSHRKSKLCSKNKTKQKILKKGKIKRSFCTKETKDHFQASINSMFS